MADAVTTRGQRLGRLIEIVITLVVLVAVGWQFAILLQRPGLSNQSPQINWGWLAVSAVLYLLGISTSGVYWHHLLHRLGQRPASLAATLQAYYLGQLGRYVPGKVVGVVWRSRLLRGPHVHCGIAALTVVYEALTTLASAALLAGTVLGADDLADGDLGWKTWGLAALVGLPLLPAVFNRLVDRLTWRWRDNASMPLPRVRGTTLLLGLGLATIGWVVQGAALVALTEAVFPGAVPWGTSAVLRCSAYVGLAYAIGFIILPVPGGIGVREFILQRFLMVELAPALAAGAGPGAVFIALVSRLIWTIADVSAAIAAWFLPAVVPSGRSSSTRWRAREVSQPVT